MAVWRTKAYEVFGLKPGAYSYSRGKVDLFASLVDWAKLAVEEGDAHRLRLIAGYVEWAASQQVDELASAVELAFFLPVFRDLSLCESLRPYVSEDLFAEKWRLLMDAPT